MALVADQTARVPAWKKLGLQLKSKTEESNKRPFDQTFGEKQDYGEADNVTTHFKSTVNSDVSVDRAAKKRKSVSFSEDTKREDGDQMEGLVGIYLAKNTGGKAGFSADEASGFSAIKTHPANLEKSNKNSRPKSERASKKNHTHLTETETKRPQIIDYLMKFHADRAHWKFNKHIQTLLLRHIFDLDRLPSTLDEAIESYIKGLQGEGPRQLLVESANRVLEETGEMDNIELENKKGMELNKSEKLQIDQDRNNALKRHLFNEKIRLREEEDVEEVESEEFQIKLTKRRRAQYILRALDGNSPIALNEYKSHEDIQRTHTNRLLGPFNPVLSAQTLEESDPSSKNRKFRRKVNTTGLTDDDIESISSVESDLLNDASTSQETGKANVNDTKAMSDSDSVSSASSSEIESDTETESSSESDTDDSDDSVSG
jgi:WKF domain